jgi:methylmalonyl-CoA carboxyltransferase large subunit
MTLGSTDQRSLLESLDALRKDVAQLGERLAAVEAAGKAPPAAWSANQPPAPLTSVSEELLGVISAAIAAYLGVLPHIRQISLVGGASWAQQGRVTIQASHTFEIRHD